MKECIVFIVHCSLICIYNSLNFCCLLVALFEENIRSSKSKFIGVFDPDCNVSTVVQGGCGCCLSRKSLVALRNDKKKAQVLQEMCIYPTIISV